MKKFLLALTLSITSLTTQAFESETEESKHRVNLDFGLSKLIFDDERGVKNDIGWYYSVGYQIDKNWGLAFDYSKVDTKTDDGGEYIIGLWSLNGTYRLNPIGEDSFFAKAGIGQYGTEPSTGGTLRDYYGRAGVGYDWMINDQVSWKTGLDFTQNPKTYFGDDVSEFVVYTGVSYLLDF